MTKIPQPPRKALSWPQLWHVSNYETFVYNILPFPRSWIMNVPIFHFKALQCRGYASGTSGSQQGPLDMMPLYFVSSLASIYSHISALSSCHRGCTGACPGFLVLQWNPYGSWCNRKANFHYSLSHSAGQEWSCKYFSLCLFCLLNTSCCLSS